MTPLISRESLVEVSVVQDSVRKVTAACRAGKLELPAIDRAIRVAPIMPLDLLTVLVEIHLVDLL
jgi:hypothetical protein